jgi:hypothetical protein
MEPVKGFTDFETLHRYEIATALSRTRLSYHVARLRGRMHTTLEYDAASDKIHIVISESLYDRLALFRPDATYTLYLEIANLLLLYLSADAHIAPLRPTHYAAMSQHIHPQSRLLASAMLLPLAAVAKAATSPLELTVSNVVARWSIAPRVAAERLAAYRRIDTSVICASEEAEVPVTIQPSDDNRRWWRALSVLENTTL